MSTITTITQAVYFTLRKNLGREAKKPKTPVVSSFFKKLRSEQDKYNKAVSPARKSVQSLLSKIYTSVLTSIHKKPRIAKPKVEQAPEIIIDIPVCKPVFETITYEDKSVKAVLVDFSDESQSYESEDSECESYVNEEEEFVKWSKLQDREYTPEEIERNRKAFDDMNAEYAEPCEFGTYYDSEDEEIINEKVVCESVFEVLCTQASTESEFTEPCESEEEDFEDVICQDFQVKSRRIVKISAVGLSVKAKKSLKVQTIKSLNKQQK